MNEEEIRAKFEAWYIREGDSKKAIERSASLAGQYVLMQTQLQWVGFLGGYAAAMTEHTK
ncbi:MAG: hypothetical protein KGL39_47215 [Patescibacteria group bacterium]|nr:hypothetical protein [Patescibacteria group bacterium]